MVKKCGTAAFTSGDQTNSFNNLNSKLKEAGIYIVPVGEIEKFVKDVGGHGPEWVNNVLEKYPDLNNDVYNEIKGFMKEVFEIKD